MKNSLQGTFIPGSSPGHPHVMHGSFKGLSMVFIYYQKIKNFLQKIKHFPDFPGGRCPTTFLFLSWTVYAYLIIIFDNSMIHLNNYPMEGVQAALWTWKPMIKASFSTYFTLVTSIFLHLKASVPCTFSIFKKSIPEKKPSKCLRKINKKLFERTFFRHGVSFKTIVGKSKSVTEEIITPWTETTLPTNLSCYPLENIFNAAKLGITVSKTSPYILTLFRGEGVGKITYP